MKKRTIIFVFIIFIFLSHTFANKIHYSEENNDSTKFYIGINPVALFTWINTPLAKLIIPTFSNLEYDLALNGGYFINNNSTIETRISFGKPSLSYFTFQAHLGYNVFISKIVSKKKNEEKGGFYTGVFARFINNNNLLTHVKFNTVIPNIALGYRWEKKRLFYDLRFNQIFAAYSWSTLEHTKPNYGWYFSGTTLTPIYPFVSFNLGIRL